MTYYASVPIEVATECYLHQAADWVSFHRLPRAELTEFMHDFNFNSCKSKNHPYYYSIGPDRGGGRCEEFFPFCEYERNGLPRDPECGCDPENSLSFDEWARINSIKRAKGFEEICAALTKGTLVASGIKLLARDFKENSDLMKKEGKTLQDLPLKKIPTTWNLGKIDWDQSQAEVGEVRYIRIRLKTEELFEKFPPPSAITKSASKVAGYYTFDETEPEEGEFTKSSCRGRKPFNDWHIIDYYIVQRTCNGDRIPKQEAEAEAIRELYKKNYGIYPLKISSIEERIRMIDKAREIAKLCSGSKESPPQS